MCKSDVSSAQLPSSDVSSAQPSSKLKAHLPPHRAYARGSHTELERSPKRLILIRHGESMGNVDSKIYCTQADNQVHLTREGFLQAMRAGESLKKLIGDDSVRFFVSPYVRTRETLNGIIKSWGEQVKWTEDPRLREQEFGNFQEEALMKKAREQRSKFGRFYYRFQDGESGADVYDRVSAFVESLWKYWQLHDYNNYVLVTHGLTIQLFLMRWFKYDVDEFHRCQNPGNCEYYVLEKVDGQFQISYSQPLDGPPIQDRTHLPEKYWNPREIYDDPPPALTPTIVEDLECDADLATEILTA